VVNFGECSKNAVKIGKQITDAKNTNFYHSFGQFSLIFASTCTDFHRFYQTFTAVKHKSILLFTNLPTSGINFKIFTSLIFYHGKP
jgi:hypothetical protein